MDSDIQRESYARSSCLKLLNDWVVSVYTTLRGKDTTASRHACVSQRIEAPDQFNNWLVYFCLHGFGLHEYVWRQSVGQPNHDNWLCGFPTSLSVIKDTGMKP